MSGGAWKYQGAADVSLPSMPWPIIPTPNFVTTAAL
jgi:hypothetical protein